MNLLRQLRGATLLAVASGTLCLHGDPARPDLRGRITRENGSPATNVTVFVYTATPKIGTAVMCPSCYPDCGKLSRTSAGGEFVVPALDPRLRFRLLLAGPGYESKFVDRVDPAAGEIREVLEPVSEQKKRDRHAIEGMVMDEQGRPVVGAVVGPEGVGLGVTTQWGGTDRHVDPIAVADDQGRFRLYSSKAVNQVHALVEARGQAKRWVELRPDRDHLVRMSEGVTVIGRVVRDGEGVANVEVGLVTKDWTCGRFIRGEELATDKDGWFVLPNATPDREWVLYGKMASLDGHALLARTFKTGASGKTNLGPLQVQRAHRLAGQVVLTDGRPVPAGTRLQLGRETAWDNLEVTLDPRGNFEFRGVPPESIALNVRVNGYKCSRINPNLDWLNGGILGRVDRDIADFVIVLEPGQWRGNGEEGEPPDGVSQPRDKPLLGARRGIKHAL